MFKWILTLILLFSIQLSELEGLSLSSQTTTAASDCSNCANSGQTAMDALERFAEEMNAITDGILDIEIISDKMNYSNKCDNFVGNGEVNRWGHIIKKELKKKKYKTLVAKGSKDITNYCPNYRKMSLENRKAVLILTLTAMTHYESSCNFRETAPGPNGTAAGLLQLHRGREHRYSEGCRKGDADSAERSLICGLSMLNEQIVDRGERLFSSASYWEVLRPRGRSRKAKKIMTAISKFPACSPAKKVKVQKLSWTSKNSSFEVAKR